MEQGKSTKGSACTFAWLTFVRSPLPTKGGVGHVLDAPVRVSKPMQREHRAVPPRVTTQGVQVPSSRKSLGGSATNA